MELVFGIRIVYKKDNNSRPEEGTIPRIAEFYIEKGNPRSPTFFTSPALRKLIENKLYEGVSPEKRIGHMKMAYYSDQRLMRWRWYLPHYFLTEVFRMHQVNKSGIASGLEKKVLKRFKREFPQVKTIKENSPSHARQNQMKNRGILVRELFEGYPFRRSIRRLRLKINRSKNQRTLNRPR